MATPSRDCLAWKRPCHLMEPALGVSAGKQPQTFGKGKHGRRTDWQTLEKGNCENQLETHLWKRGDLRTHWPTFGKEPCYITLGITSASKNLWKKGLRIDNSEKQSRQVNEDKVMRIVWSWFSKERWCRFHWYFICRLILDCHPWKRVTHWATGLSLKIHFLYIDLCQNIEFKTLILDSRHWLRKLIFFEN